MKKIYLMTFFFCTLALSAQETLSSIIKKNSQTFIIENNAFVGDGWDEILDQIKTHNNVLIGEDHFFNEIPFFISKINDEVKFDNFFCEIDPYLAKILESKIKNLSASELAEFINTFSNTFSFFTLEPEFKLLKQLIKSNTNIIGTDQIALISERIMVSELKLKSKNEIAKSIYSEIEKQSEIYFAEFIKGENGPYFYTDEFTAHLNKLDSLELSAHEHTVIRDLKLSQSIYLEQDHHLRIQLMKNNLMRYYNLIPEAKNLYKYGAAHLPKGESLFKIQDIGNLVNNIADSQFESSLHIMIIGNSGFQGVPFEGMEYQKIDADSNDLKHYKVFFDAMEKNKWNIFNNKEILKKLTKHKIKIEDKTLERVLAGYDYFIVIPEVTPADFLN